MFTVYQEPNNLTAWFKVAYNFYTMLKLISQITQIIEPPIEV